jgi:hypothetical protein
VADVARRRLAESTDSGWLAVSSPEGKIPMDHHELRMFFQVVAELDAMLGELTAASR